MAKKKPTETPDDLDNGADEGKLDEVLEEGQKPKKKPAAPKFVCDVRPKTRGQWMALVKAKEANHWRKLHVTIQMRDKLMAGKPAQLDAGIAMLKARGLQAAIEAVDIEDPNALAAAAATTVNEGLCEFHRREGRPGLWLPTNNIKAMIKENWSVLGYRNEIRGSRGRLAEGLFVYSVPQAGDDPVERDWLLVGAAPDGVAMVDLTKDAEGKPLPKGKQFTAVSHTTGPSGPVSAIKRHEYVEGTSLTFEIAIARKNVMEGLDDGALADVLVHAAEHGLGACRSQGFGRFQIKDIVELGVDDELPAGVGEGKAA